jgi:hypothetical protein
MCLIFLPSHPSKVKGLQVTLTSISPAASSSRRLNRVEAGKLASVAGNEPKADPAPRRYLGKYK